MYDKNLMKQCLIDAIEITMDVDNYIEYRIAEADGAGKNEFVDAAWKYQGIIQHSIGRVACELFNKRYWKNSGYQGASGGNDDGPTVSTGETESECCEGEFDSSSQVPQFSFFSNEWQGDRIKKFLASREQRRALCRKLLSLSQWLTSENTFDTDRETVKIYREQTYDLMCAIEETLR